MARRRYTRRRRRASSRKKNIVPTRLPTSMASARYQWRQLHGASKVAALAIAAGAVGGSAAVGSMGTVPYVGKYLAAFGNMGAKVAKKY